MAKTRSTTAAKKDGTSGKKPTKKHATPANPTKQKAEKNRQNKNRRLAAVARRLLEEKVGETSIGDVVEDAMVSVRASEHVEYVRKAILEWMEELRREYNV